MLLNFVFLSVRYTHLTRHDIQSDDTFLAIPTTGIQDEYVMYQRVHYQVLGLTSGTNFEVERK